MPIEERIGLITRFKSVRVYTTVLALGMFLFAGLAQATIITNSYIISTFENGNNASGTNLDGWAGTGVAPLVVVTPGGSPLANPTGTAGTSYLDVQDSQNKVMLLTAPADYPVGSTTTAFSGDLTRFNNIGFIGFDALVKKISGGPTSTVFPEFGQITITNTVNNLTAQTILPTVAPIVNQSTSYQQVAYGLVYTNFTGTGAADAATWATLLSNVATITVDLSLRQSSSDEVFLDNFKMQVPEPGYSLALLGAGIVGIVVKRRRS
jgi:hypothetical protein